MKFPVTPVTAVTEGKSSFLFRFWSAEIPLHFTPKNCDFGSKPEEKKGNSQPHRTSRPLPAVLPPVGRFVASQGGGRVRIPPGPFGSLSRSFSVRRKRSRRKGWRRARPHSGHFCPQCGQLRDSTTGVVERHFRRVVGSKTEKIPQLRNNLRGHSKILRRNMKMTNNKEK